MSIVRMIVLTTLIVFTSSLSAKAQLGRSPIPSQGSLSRFNLTRAWWGTADLNASRDRLMHLTVDDDNLYAQASNGIITAFDAQSGKRLWATQLGTRDEASFPATENDDLLLVVSGMSLYAVEKDNGNIRWQIRLPRFPSTSPIADSENLYVGFLDGSVSAFQLKTIESLYKENLLPQWSAETVRWRYRTSGEISVPPSSSGRFVAFASQNGSLYSVTPDDRRLMFQFETDAPLSAPIARYEGFLLIASEDFRVYSVNAESGSVRWQFVTGLPILRAPVVIEDDVYLLPERGGMYMLNARTGAPRESHGRNWFRPEVTGFLSATTTRVYGVDEANNLLIMSREDAGILGALPVRRFTVQLVNERNDRIYMATPDGLIIALRETDRIFPKFYQNPDRQPIVPEFATEDPEAVEPATEESATEDPATEEPTEEETGAEEAAE